MKENPLRFKVEYSVVNPPWEKGRPKYTAKVLLTDRRALRALGCDHLEKLEKDLGMHFWDWSAMQIHVAKAIASICEQLAEKQLPEQPTVDKGETARVIHSVVMAPSAAETVAKTSG
jgi:hypothetical protein